MAQCAVFQARRTPTSREGGFTLIELMAALTLMAIGIVGVIGVMNSTFRVAGTASSRSKAISVATKTLEMFRAKPYNQLAIQAATDPVVSYTEKVGGQTFTVETAIQASNEAATYGAQTPTSNAYKKAYVWVKWNDGGGSHTVSQETLIYPGGLGVYNPTNTATRVTSNLRPLAPLSLTATPVSTTADITLKTAVDLQWVPPATTSGVAPVASWVVQYAAFDCNGTLCTSFPWTEVQEVAAFLPASMTTLRINDFATSSKYHFRVYAKSADGVISTDYAQALNVTGITSPATVCSIGAASVTPAAVKKRTGSDSGKLVSSPVVQVNLLASCAGRTFQMDYSPNDGLTRTVNLTGSTTLNGTIDGTRSEWVIGERRVSVYSVLDGVRTLRANLRLTVCDNAKAVCP